MALVPIPATKFIPRVKSHHFPGAQGNPQPFFFLQTPLFFDNSLTHHYPAALCGGYLLFIQSAEYFLHKFEGFSALLVQQGLVQSSVWVKITWRWGMGSLALFPPARASHPRRAVPKLCVLYSPPLSSNRFSSHQSQRAPGNF